MSELTTIVTLIGEIGVLIGVITPVIMSMRKISNGTKCQLRSEMLSRLKWFNFKNRRYRISTNSSRCSFIER